MTANNRIKVLTPSVFNKIAAGEVVEKPASALKELVENSIDAGARRIVIEVEKGGLDKIAVTDNGCGIHEDDIEAAFIKHATSKLDTADDLNSIETLGFRGEALSSIAAVAKVRLTTRRADADAAVCVELADGKITSKQYVTANVGTKIEISDLFYNVPARKKFLKTYQREGIDITKFVSKLILTNPNLEISYISDGKTVYKTQGNGLSEAIFVIYGSNCLSNCLPINFEAQYMRITGYVGSPEYVKANSTYQTLSVNGRLVSDKSVQGSIAQAFRPYLMTRKFPFYVLDLTIPCDMVDVNVHPRKTEVRFQNINAVCGNFYRAVQAALKQFSDNRVNEILGVGASGADMRTSDEKSAPYIPTSDENGSETDSEEYVNYDFDTSLFRNITEMTANQVEDIMAIEAETKKQRQQPLEEFADELERTLTVQSARKAMGLDTASSVHQAVMPIFESDDDFAEQNDTASPGKKDITDELLAKTRILGAAFRTYLILELDDKLILVDQHAAHERILFDKFMEGKAGSMQQLMFPYVFSVKEDEADFIERNIPNILQAGLEIEPFGLNTFRICAVSTLLSDMKMDEFVQYMLSSADELRIDDKTLVVEKLAKKACKAAVKAGYVLNELEIRYILKAIYENKVLQCPHGRPVTVVFTKAQLEKMFKRTV